jgi:hypothetical protein
MWFAWEAAPDGNAFWIAEYFDIGGPIDALRRRVSLARITGDYLTLYRKVLADRRDAARPPDDGPLAAFVADFLPKLNEHERRSKLEAAADQRRRELDDGLALNAREEGADAEITFTASTLGRLLLDDGWHAAEDWCVWSGDAVAHLRLPAALLARSGGEVTVRCACYFPRNSPEDDRRTIDVFAAGQKIATWEFARAAFVGNRIDARALRIPEALMGKGTALRLAFHPDRTVSPLEAGEGDDPRQLGLALVSIAAEGVAGSRGA